MFSGTDCLRKHSKKPCRRKVVGKLLVRWPMISNSPLMKSGCWSINNTAGKVSVTLLNVDWLGALSPETSPVAINLGCSIDLSPNIY